MTADHAKPGNRRAFEKLGATPSPSLRERFNELKKFDDGKLWERLNGISPGPDGLIEELPPPTLYHYTDVRGLHGILESNSLRASAAYYLNDSSEIEYGRKLLIDELKTWFDLNKDGEGFASLVLAGILATFSAEESKISRASNIYVSCFCEEDDVLSQWRAYGQKGGYSLGFDTNRLSTGLIAPVYYNRVRLAKVIYDAEMQLRRVRSVLRQFLTAIGAAVQLNLPPGTNTRGLFDDHATCIPRAPA